MPPTSSRQDSKAAASAGVSSLGVAHPLVATIEAVSVVTAQVLAVSAVLAAGLIAVVTGARWGAALTVSAAVVLLCLAGRAALLLQLRREQVVTLIASGDGDVPIAVVGRELRRLRSERMRRRLAASLEDLVDEALNPCVFAPRPLFDPRIVAGVAHELQEIAELLRDERADVRAVALVWRLICDGVASPLHRGEGRELREELGRIRFALAAAPVREGPKGGSMGPNTDDVGSRDFRFGVTGLLVMIVVALLFALFS